ncbi:hypothetical protein JOF29_007315 [Kribbella aluminosa]|uniref:TrbL/VirB6 plasmid conjugal transfer protein n=1 Tax=Kribbella aluminosa TaxID=416017 RepID=A0ABS4UX43_9ACTN|nr:hypothetical protein [Kribbella aluminosa]MBP2356205.1 hypothetical protein [Kribbella aluminosa]
MAWSDCLLSPVGCAVDAVGGKAASSVWDSFLKWTANGLADLSSNVFQMFSTSTSPTFDQAWWKDNLDLMVGLSLPILVGVFVLQCVSAVIRREPGRLGHAAVGALIGSAGVPLAVAAIAACGRAVDQISVGLLSAKPATDGIKRMIDITAFLAVPTYGGILLLALELGLLAMFSLYFVMLIRDVALVAFVVFAPIAMVSWTWSATRHWLRRWIEVVGALLFSKIAMAVVFTLGFSAVGAPGQDDAPNIGTFIAGILLVAMAAFAPLATYSFIHWAGDHSQAATRMLQQGTAGVDAGKDQLERVQQWTAGDFSGSDKDDESPVTGDDQDPDGESTADSSTDSTDAGEHSDQATDPADSQPAADSAAQPDAPPTAGSDSGGTVTAVATSEVSVEGDSSGPGDSSSSASERGD